MCFKKNSQQSKVQNQMVSQKNSIKHLKNSYYLSSSNYSKKLEYGTLTNLFYKVTIILKPKTDKDSSNNKNYRPISLMNTDAKFLNNTLANPIYQYIKSITYHDQVGVIPSTPRWFSIHKSINVIYHINKRRIKIT